MDMAELNQNLEDYKLNELFDLAAWMHGEQFPYPVMFKKKKLVVKCCQINCAWKTKKYIGY